MNNLPILPSAIIRKIINDMDITDFLKYPEFFIYMLNFTYTKKKSYDKKLINGFILEKLKYSTNNKRYRQHTNMVIYNDILRNLLNSRTFCDENMENIGVFDHDRNLFQNNNGERFYESLPDYLEEYNINIDHEISDLCQCNECHKNKFIPSLINYIIEDLCHDKTRYVNILEIMIDKDSSMDFYKYSVFYPTNLSINIRRGKIFSYCEDFNEIEIYEEESEGPCKICGMNYTCDECEYRDTSGIVKHIFKLKEKYDLEQELN